MNKKLIDRLFGFNGILIVLGLIGHIFFYYVQENFYTQSNFLKPINDILNSQTSATTYFVVLYLAATQMILALFVIFLTLRIQFWLKVLIYYLAPILPGLVYTAYEYQQMLNPTYPDNHILDIVLAWAAIFTFWVGYTLIFLNTKRDGE